RDRFLRAIGGASNPLIYAGDSHNAWAGYARSSDGSVMVPEFDGTSVTSPGFSRANGMFPPSLVSAGYLQANPDMRFMDSAHRGFLLFDLDHDRHVTQYIAADQVTAYNEESELPVATCVVAFKVSAGTASMERMPCRREWPKRSAPKEDEDSSEHQSDRNEKLDDAGSERFAIGILVGIGMGSICTVAKHYVWWFLGNECAGILVGILVGIGMGSICTILAQHVYTRMASNQRQFVFLEDTDRL
ncbi:hypothetical protein CYMTET_29020, partial [Cymbomonas tetramitiformis]